VSSLPSNWIETALANLATIEMGQSPNSRSYNNEGIGLPFFQGKSEFQAVFPEIRKWCSEPTKVVERGDILLSIRAPVGPTNIAPQKSCIGRGLAGIRGEIDVSQAYLHYFFKSIEPWLSEQGTGSTFAAISGQFVRVLSCPVAPAAEQTRIVAKLEELFSDLDAGVAELKAAQKKLAQCRQSLLKAAVEGALTADWRAQHPSTETGAQLLARILRERRTRWDTQQLAKFESRGKTPPKDWQAKYPEPAQPDTTDFPALPEGWVWTSLDQLVAESSYGTSVKCSYESNGIPVLRIPNVSGGCLDLRDIKFSTTDLNLGKDDHLAVGDVLVIRTNGSINLVGRAATVVNDLPTQHYFASYLLRLRCTEITCVHRWILTLLTAPAGRQWLEARAASSAGQHNISLSTLLTMPVPLPPLAEQISILKEVEESRELIKRQEEAAELSLKQSTAQRQNILRAAFLGQLVPQDPNDEPASVLLARIRAERIEREKQPKIRKNKQKKEITAVVRKLIDVLGEAGDWVPAQEAFRRCGVADGALTDQIEALYAELRALDRAGRLAVETVADMQGRKLHDRLKLLGV
jgi:type I restriction enzyme, S subunit